MADPAPQRLSPREAKRLVLADVAMHARTLTVPASLDEHDRALYAAAREEVADEIYRRHQGYDRPRAVRGRWESSVDELLCQLRDLGVTDETVIRSRAQRHRHGWHAVAWTHPDGSEDSVEASTAERAVRKALRATEARLRKNRRGAAA